MNFKFCAREFYRSIVQEDRVFSFGHCSAFRAEHCGLLWPFYYLLNISNTFYWYPVWDTIIQNTTNCVCLYHSIICLLFLSRHEWFITLQFCNCTILYDYNSCFNMVITIYGMFCFFDIEVCHLLANYVIIIVLGYFLNLQTHFNSVFRNHMKSI